MADEQFDPSQKPATDVVDHIAEASPEEVAQIVAAERAGKGRKTVLQAAGEVVDPDARYDASGRALNAWEVSPKPLPAEDEN